MKESKNKKTIIVLFVLIVIGILLVINRTQVYTLAKNTVRNILRLGEDETTEETKVYCEVTDPVSGKTDVFVEFQNPKGIEKLIIGEDIIETKGKTKVAIDRKLNEGEVYQIKVKLNGQEEEELYTGVASRTLPNVVLKNKDTFNDGTTKTVEIEAPENENIINYYSLDDGQTWEIYTEELKVPERNNSTIVAKYEAKKGTLIKVSNISEQIPLIVSDGLASAVKNANIIRNDHYYRIAVKEKEYYAHVYVEKGDIILESSKSYGVASDTQYMVILKVNGDLTINEGVTLTAYGTSNGGTKGMIVCATGTLINNGTISMTARGARGAGEDVYLWKNNDNSWEYVPAAGTAGGAGGVGYSSYGGGAGGTPGAASNRRTGGGGGGAGQCGRCRGGSGTAGTSYSGGTGGGGGAGRNGTNGAVNGGAGGTAYSALQGIESATGAGRRCRKSRRSRT